MKRNRPTETEAEEAARLSGTAADPPSLEHAHLRASTIACAVADEWAAEGGYTGEHVRDALGDALIDALDALVIATRGSSLRKVDR